MPAIPEDLIWRLSINQYHDMIRAGILTDDDPVELLEGWLVFKMPKNPPHRVATRMFRQALEKRVKPGWYVDSQEPITLESSEPEPDGTVVRGESRDYLNRHPNGGEIGLIAEIADTNLERDRGLKKNLYARARLPVYWIVNLVDRQTEVYTDPGGNLEEADYATRTDYRPGDNVPLFLDGVHMADIPVGELLP